jgi:plasmid rolling circle replication initiator protein Rep
MMNKYNTKKTRNQGTYKFMDKHIPYKSKKRFCECGNWIESLADREESKMKVHRANFCKNRFCPLCAWRLAEKDAMKISVLMDYIRAEHGKNFIFVTLTAPNVKAENLKDEITRYNDAFKKLCKRDEIEKINQGYIRKLEITYNTVRDDYHPHFHCIFAVNSSYFKKRDYVKQETWLDLWCNVMKDESIMQVDVRRVKVGGASGRDKAVKEVAKYAAKDEDYTCSQEVFDVFYEALKGRQVITYNDLFAMANKKYKDKELEHYKTRDETEYVWLILHQWGGSKYMEKQRREIDQDQYKRLKRDSVDDVAIG